MKKNSLPAFLAAGCSIAGVLCLALRGWLLAAGIDRSGMLVAGHPAAVITWIITGLILLFLAVNVLRSKAQCYFPDSPMTACNGILQAIALGVLAVSLFLSNDNLSTITAIVTLLAAVCCVGIPIFRNNGKDFPPMLRSVTIIFYLLFMIYRYQDWCCEPALQLYGFELLALVCLALAAYQRVALDVGVGSSRTYLIATNGGVFFCLACIPGNTNGAFYLLMAAAAVLDGCAVRSKREA